MIFCLLINNNKMDDYLYYIDFGAIKLGDLAHSLGDFKMAATQYNKALTKLRTYQGDRMQPTHMAKELVDKLSQMSRYLHAGKPILTFETWRLSKSSFVKGNQCLKYLFLDKHKKKEKTPLSATKLALFEKGHSFETSIRHNYFPGGIDVKANVGNFGYFNSYTKNLLRQTGRCVLYEGTIIEDDVLVMCDILIKNEDGLIDIYEIKLNSEINDVIISDLAIQYTIAKKRFAEKLNSFNLILSDQNNPKGHSITELTELLRNKTEAVNQQIIAFKQTLIHTEPDMEMGTHCKEPYECEFIDYCKKCSLEKQ
jgi:hypothetical protein